MKGQARHITTVWTLLSAMLSVPTLAEATDVYKSVDKDGVVTFSDAPPKETASTQVTVTKINATNSMPGVDVPIVDATSDIVDALEPRSVAISSPSDNATIPMGAGIFDVTAKLMPPLLDGELLALYLDDELVGTPQSSNVWTLTYVIRGRHRLQVRRISSEGETVSESEVISVFVLRPSVLRGVQQ